MNGDSIRKESHLPAWASTPAVPVALKKPKQCWNKALSKSWCGLILFLLFVVPFHFEGEERKEKTKQNKKQCLWRPEESTGSRVAGVIGT